MALAIHPADQVDRYGVTAGKSHLLAPDKTSGPLYDIVVHMVRNRPDEAFLSEFTLRDRHACAGWASTTGR